MSNPLDHVRFVTSPPLVDRSGRAVIVDPSSEHRKLLRGLLESDGCECVSLADGDELLRVCAEFEPDLLLMAVELPTAGGLELCGDVRANDPGRHLPVILLGPGAAAQEVAAGLLAGADDFITDLGRSAELRARIHVQLRNKRLLDALQRVRSERDLLRRDAQIDALTGLLNRRSLEGEANDRWRARSRFGVLFMDLDHFKSVNDSFGHEVGDRVLVAVAGVLRSALRPGDVIARFGGEEFVALIAGAGPESVRLVGERLRRHVEEMPHFHRGPRRVTISVGATVFDPERSPEAPPEVLRRADVALYAAKRAGRNRVILIPAGELIPEAEMEASSGSMSTTPWTVGPTSSGEASSR